MPVPGLISHASTASPGEAAMAIQSLIQRQTERATDSAGLAGAQGQFLSYQMLAAQIERGMASLRKNGIGVQDRVAVVLPNGLDLALTFLAVGSCAGCAPLNPAYRDAEFDYYFSSIKPAALIVGDPGNPAAMNAAARYGIPILRAQRVDDESGMLDFQLDGKNPRPERSPGYAAPEDLALILHTSGTTSRSKTVPLFQRNLCQSARNIADWLSLAPSDCCLNVMPLFHVHGLIGGLLASIAAGSSVWCAPEFNASQFFDWLDRSRASWYTAVPTMHQAILAQSAAHHEVIERRRLRFIRSCSSAMPAWVFDQLREVFRAPLIEAYGMTEASHQIACNPLPPLPQVAGSVGLPTGTEIAILDRAGQEVPRGESGEVSIKGANVIRAYENNPEANQSAFHGQWLRTGDEGYFDSNGYLFLTGRLKEMINRGGEKVSPREVDDILLEHGSVMEAVAFAIPHATLGEDVAAAVVLKDKAFVSPDELRQFVALRLAPFKVPQKIIVVGALPKGATGKLQRSGLAEKFAHLLVSDYVAPRNISEQKLANIWSEVLGVASVGVTDHFFSLGGDSLHLVMVSAKAREAGMKLAANDIFNLGTIARCVDSLAQMDSASERNGMEKAHPEAPRGGSDRTHDSESFPLTPQQQVVVSTQKEPLVPEELLFLTVWKLEGDLDLNAFREAWLETARANPILRTAFAWDSELSDGAQIVHADPVLDWESRDFSNLAEEEREAAIQEYWQSTLRVGMNAEKLPLFRLRLAQFSKQKYRLACVWHHAIMDIWVSLMAIQEVLARYEGIHSGVRPDIPARRPFRDYVEWIGTKKQTAAAEEFWRQHLGNFSMQSLRRSTPRFWTDGGQREQTELRNNLIDYVPADLVRKIQSFARKHQLTPTTVFYAAWSLVQSVYQDEDDIVMHTTTSGRWSELDRVDTILGPIVANQPFRVNTGFSTSVEDWLAHLQAQHGLVQSYDFVSVKDLQKWVKTVPPIWCVLVFQNFPLKLWQTVSKTLAVQFQYAYVWMRRPLAIFFFPNSSEGFRIQMTYDPGRFTGAEIGKAMQALFAAAGYLTGENKMSVAEMKGRLRGLLAS